MTIRYDFEFYTYGQGAMRLFEVQERLDQLDYQAKDGDVLTVTFLETHSKTHPSEMKSRVIIKNYERLMYESKK